MITKKLLLASLLGGIAVFIWGAISHMALPFANNALNKFTNEEAVTQMIKENAPKSGIYFMPYEPQKNGMSQAKYDAAMEKMKTQMMSGPFVFASVRVGPMGSFGAYFITQILTDMLGVFFMAIVVFQLSSFPFWKKVLLAVFIYLVGFCAEILPLWNWYSFSTPYTLSELLDTTMAGFLSGMIVARFSTVKQ